MGSVPPHRNEEVCSSSCLAVVLSLIILLLTNYNLYLSVYLFVCFHFSSKRYISFFSNQILWFKEPRLPDCEKHKGRVSLLCPRRMRHHSCHNKWGRTFRAEKMDMCDGPIFLAAWSGYCYLSLVTCHLRPLEIPNDRVKLRSWKMPSVVHQMYTKIFRHQTHLECLIRWIDTN